MLGCSLHLNRLSDIQHLQCNLLLRFQLALCAGWREQHNAVASCQQGSDWDIGRCC
jgi:hypothetical protein